MALVNSYFLAWMFSILAVSATVVISLKLIAKSYYRGEYRFDGEDLMVTAVLSVMFGVLAFFVWPVIFPAGAGIGLGALIVYKTRPRKEDDSV